MAKSLCSEHGGVWMFFISFWMPKTYALQIAVNVAVLSFFIQPISFFMLFVIIFLNLSMSWYLFSFPIL